MVKLTPPMGWNSWNTFGENINEKLIMETADKMVEQGLLDCGYEYLVIDDCWSLRKRDEEGRLIADPEKFPHGMKAVADYVHSKGLKFGMYSCAGNLTCAGYPGSFEHEFIDADTFASWGVDFLKYDYCYHSNIIPGKYLYRRMGIALENCGRDILFSACSWGADQTHEWIKETGASMWRSTGDIFDSWESIKDLTKQQAKLHPYHSVGCFNDMDMLVVGMYGEGNVGLGGCSDAEYRSHFALWCLFNSPLMIGCDIRNLNEESRKLLQNKDLIAINQDPEARPPRLITAHGDNRMVFFRLLADGEYAFAFFNFNDTDSVITCLFPDLGLPVNSGYVFQMTDAFTGETFQTGRECFAPMVGRHDCKVYRARLVRK